MFITRIILVVHGAKADNVNTININARQQEGAIEFDKVSNSYHEGYTYEIRRTLRYYTIEYEGGSMFGSDALSWSERKLVNRV
jgi:hypothetical protein